VTMLDRSPEAETLVERARRGDHAAFGTLAGRHRPVLHDHLMRITGSEATTEELIAETFLRAWDSIAGGARPPAAFGTWLTVIASQAARDLVHLAQSRPELVSDDLAPWDDLLDAADAHLLLRCTEDLVREALDRLPAQQRDVLVKRFYDEQTVAQVARGLGRTKGAVKQLQHRGVRNLSRLLPADAQTG
jgi:RNA polymerase sigma-70 factor (ECF subfamily)